MKIIGFTGTGGRKIGIPVNKITGFCEAGHDTKETFIATGEGSENGWVVMESYAEVWMMLEAVDETNE